MAQLFARVELRGNPSVEIYQNLHNHLRSQYWYPSIQGVLTLETNKIDVKALPHATYQQITNEENPNLAAVADQLKKGIEANVWTKALVLVIQSSNWAQSSG